MGLGSSGDSNCDRRTEGRSDEASTRDATHLKTMHSCDTETIREASGATGPS
jgi:hypothetical protein